MDNQAPNFDTMATSLSNAIIGLQATIAGLNGASTEICNIKKLADDIECLGRLIENQLDRAEKNTIVRIQNSHASKSYHRLKPLVEVNGNAVENFPPTIGDLLSLAENDFDDLCVDLGFVTGGPLTLKQKKNSLLEFVGVQPFLG